MKMQFICLTFLLLNTLNINAQQKDSTKLLQVIEELEPDIAEPYHMCIHDELPMHIPTIIDEDSIMGKKIIDKQSDTKDQKNTVDSSKLLRVFVEPKPILGAPNSQRCRHDEIHANQVLFNQRSNQKYENHPWEKR